MPYLNRSIGIACCTAAFCAPQLSAAEPAVLRVEVLDTAILEEPKVNGLKVAELSGLAYDRKNQRLFAVSDKGRIFEFALDLSDDRLAGLRPLHGRNLVDAEGAKMRDSGFNAEGMALADDGTIMIVSEAGPRISRFSLDGKWLEDLPVPAGLADPSGQRSEKDGLESLALHQKFGLLTMPEEPLAAQPRTIHTVYSWKGDRFAFDTSDLGTTSIKAMEALPDGRIAMIERDVSAADNSLIPWLRILDPGNCASDGICATELARIEVPGIKDADYEGLAQISDNLFLIVSDDKIASTHRSVFGLLRVTLPSTRHPAEAGQNKSP